MPSVKFRPLDFNQLILDHGIQVFWERARVCQCYTQEATEASATCPYCKGLRFVWEPQGIIPLVGTGIKELKSTVVDFSSIRQGDMAITTLPDTKLAVNDRLRQVHSPEIYTETLTGKINASGKLVFTPYYEPYALEEAFDATGQPIASHRLTYNILTDELTVANYTGTQLSLRYTHLPSLLVTDALHTNRQQWTGETGYGELQKLPNQYTARRITSKIPSYLGSGYTQTNVLESAIPPLNPLTRNIYVTTHRGTATRGFELGWLNQQPNTTLLKLEDTYTSTIQTTPTLQAVSLLTDDTTLQAFWPILSTLGYPQKYLYIRDKYSCPRILTDVPTNAIVTFNSPDITDYTYTLLSQPTRFIADYDLNTNPSCEILIPNETSYTLYTHTPDPQIPGDFSEYAWYPTFTPLSISTDSSGQLVMTQGDTTILTGLYSSSYTNYLSISFDNTSRRSAFKIFFNGTFYQPTQDASEVSLLSNKTLTSQATLAVYRLYSTHVDLYTHNQNRSTLMKAQADAGNPAPAASKTYTLTDPFSIYCGRQVDPPMTPKILIGYTRNHLTDPAAQFDPIVTLNPDTTLQTTHTIPWIDAKPIFTISIMCPVTHTPSLIQNTSSTEDITSLFGQGTALTYKGEAYKYYEYSYTINIRSNSFKFTFIPVN